jgi:hypothetical protein
MKTEEQRISIPDALDAVERLRDWGDSEAHDKPTTFSKFLSLTGNLEQDGTLWAESCGFLECSMLATALEAWATHPNDVREWLRNQGLQ